MLPSPQTERRPAALRPPFDSRHATFFVSTVHGLEEELLSEISELAKDLAVELPEEPQLASSGVYVRAPWTFAIAMNFSLRCASRILVEIVRCEVMNMENIYRQLETLDWSRFFTVDKSFVVTSHATESSVNSSSVNLKVKDAIVDSFRRHTGERPTVDKDNPDVRVMVRLHRRSLSVSLDTTGKSLTLRGYRVAGGDAPLGEVVAAGLLRMTGWSLICRSLRNGGIEKVSLARVSESQGSSEPKGKSESTPSATGRRIPAAVPLSPELLDPMCGTGTFAIEAALQILNRRPQIQRKSFAFMNLHFFPEQALKQTEYIRRQVRAQEMSLTDAFTAISKYRSLFSNTTVSDGLPDAPIRCRDENSTALLAARKNAEAAGVIKLIAFERGDVSRIQPPASEGIVVMNPPYGHRLGDEDQLKELYKSIGDTLKQNFKGWQAWILAENGTLAGKVGLRATRRKKVFNGGLECIWLQYVLF